MRVNFKTMSVSSVAMVLALATAAPALGQSQSDDDEIIATGTIQQTIEQSIDFKRNQGVVSDALIGAEIGDLPDLSIAETLERIVGVTSDRFKGGASQLSVRGLGPFLGASYLNGREISSGSDGRDVNFGQFPSELLNGALVYKTQQAEFIEGGVSGIIELQTLRPLDYNKRRIQLQGLLGYSDYEDRVDGGDPWSERITASYVDQFSGAGFGDIGIAIGGQLRRDTAPEEIYGSSSSFRPCSTISNGSGGNCSFSPDNTNSFGTQGAYLVSNQYFYRALQTEADRDSLMANVQWQPNAAWDINLDAQWSDRFDLEERANLVIADGRRRITPIEVSDSGALLAWEGNSRLENQSVFRIREEEYIGFGLNAEWTNDLWTIAGDVGYSQTERRQDELDMRIRTNRRVDFQIDTRGVEIPVLTLLDVSDVESNTGLAFDLNNHDIYDNGRRARRRLENNDDSILSARLDFDRTLENAGIFTNLGFGARFGERERTRDDGIDQTFQGGAILAFDSPEVVATRRSNFIVEDLFDGADTAQTNASAGVYGRGLTFATWDPEALFVALTGSRDTGLPTGSTLSAEDVDITETTYAAYVQGDFENTWGVYPVYGNIGARLIYTEIDSVGISSLLEREDVSPGFFNLNEIPNSTVENLESNDFINFLPSFNMTIELNENRLLRLAAYEAIARPDPANLSAALEFDQDNDGFQSTAEIISAGGNPAIEPLKSTNFDVSFENYFTDSSIFSAAVYYKLLRTGFENGSFTTTVNIDGVDTDVELGRLTNNDDISELIGVELALQHKFENLPGFWGGFGIQAAYNYAESNFEQPDTTNRDGVNFLADFVPPANITGFSQHSGNFTVFWENDRFDARVAYRGRSRYSKPFRNDPLRFTAGQEFVDASASYDLTDNLQLRFQALNLTDEPNLFFRPTRDSFSQADFSGRRVFFGVRARY